MTHVNLSTIGGTCVLETETQGVKEYWQGAFDFTTDIEQATRYGIGNSLKMMALLTRRGIEARCVTVPGFHQLMNWVGVGWVAVNHRHEEATIHRVRFIDSGEGWFESGDPHRTLVMRVAPDSEDHYVIECNGPDIIDVTLYEDGVRCPDQTCIMIPDSSSMRYRFEIESKPHTELEVA